MKILVCISKTPDTTSKISFKDNNTKFEESGVQWIINPYDEWYALVKAIELKEKDNSVQLHLINCWQVLIVIQLFVKPWHLAEMKLCVSMRQHDSYFIAAQIAQVAKQGNYDLILTGKETIDYNSSSVGGMLSELLDMPYISLATKFELNGNSAIVTREIEGGEEKDEVIFL